MDVKKAHLNAPVDYENMLSHQKALNVKMGIMFGNLKKNPYMG